MEPLRVSSAATEIAGVVQAHPHQGVITIARCFPVKDLLKTHRAAKWENQAKVWTVPHTLHSAFELVSILGGHEIQWDDATAKMVETYGEALPLFNGEGCDEILERFPEYSTRIKNEFKRTHMQHQLVGALAIIMRDAVYLAFEPGTGKTFTVITASDLLNLKRVLVVCPKKVIREWRAEFAETTIRATDRRMEFVGLDRNSIKRRAELLQTKIDSELPIITVVNYESVWRTDLARVVESVAWDMIVLDEGHRIKDSRGDASKFFRHEGKLKTKRRVILSGTPRPNNVLDLFGQMRFLEPSLYGKWFTQFRTRVAIMGGYGSKQVVAFNKAAEDEAVSRFHRIALVVNKRDVLDLPEIQFVNKYVTLPPKARALYQEVESDLWVELGGGGAILISNILVQMMKLHQIASGTLKDDDGKLHVLHTEKEDLLAELLEDSPATSPMITFSRFHPDLDATKSACARSGRTCFELSGRVDQVDEWKAATGGEILAAQIQAGSLGLNLTRASYLTFFSIGFSYGDWYQAISRIERKGQTEPMTIYNFIAEDTIDEKIYAVIKAKEKGSKNLMERRNVTSGSFVRAIFDKMEPTEAARSSRNPRPAIINDLD